MTPSRRELLRTLGYGLAALPIACSSDGGAPVGPDAVPLDSGDMCGPEAPAWATGGTAAMTAKTCYPDPFATPLASCPLIVCPTTAGPCTATAPVREDISEGLPGLPVRLALKIVTAQTCEPVAGAVVEIWHTQITGVYSGVTPSPQQCARGDAEAPSKSYFRGTQTTDANGRVSFDTCYPGWYPGRAIHLHFRVTVGATDFIVSQLFFGELLTRDIFATHPDYAPTGQPDTTNATDFVLDGVDSTPYLLDVARMSDGAMLAAKLISIRAAGQGNC
jgi:protocatechuate 3,4-dioxygenase beta subunit